MDFTQDVWWASNTLKPHFKPRAMQNGALKMLSAKLEKKQQQQKTNQRNFKWKEGRCMKYVADEKDHLLHVLYAINKMNTQSMV